MASVLLHSNKNLENAALNAVFNARASAAFATFRSGDKMAPILKSEHKKMQEIVHYRCIVVMRLCYNLHVHRGAVW